MSTTSISVTGVTYPNLPLQRNTRPRFLMCPPRLYDVNYIINPWMSGNVHAASREVAAKQWHQLYTAVSQVADVEIVEPQPGSPDMVFTANAGLLFMSEAGERQIALSSFFHPERQGEEPHFRRWFEENGYSILRIARETPFEGEGDALFSEDGSRLWVGFGPRTLQSSHQTLRKAWDVEVLGLELIDQRFYHLDTCFAPLAGGYVLYFPQAFGAESVRAIEAYYPAKKRIVVEEADALRFACNAVNVGHTIILNRIGDALAATLEGHGFEVIQVELSEFMRAGGAAKCLVMRLNRGQAELSDL